MLERPQRLYFGGLPNSAPVPRLPAGRIAAALRAALSVTCKQSHTQCLLHSNASLSTMPFDPAKYLQTFGWDKGKGLGKNGTESCIFAADSRSPFHWHATLSL